MKIYSIEGTELVDVPGDSLGGAYLLWVSLVTGLIVGAR